MCAASAASRFCAACRRYWALTAVRDDGRLIIACRFCKDVRIILGAEDHPAAAGLLADFGQDASAAIDVPDRVIHLRTPATDSVAPDGLG